MATGTVASPVHASPHGSGLIVRAVRLVGVAIFLASLCLGAYAGFRWLRTGSTGTAVLADVVVPELPAAVRTWVREPDSWFGLHRFVVWVVEIPVFAAGGFVGFLLLLGTGTGRRR